MANTNIASPPVYTNESPKDGFVVKYMPANHNSVGFGTDAALATLLTLQNEDLAINNSYEQKNGTSVRDTFLMSGQLGSIRLECQPMCSKPPKNKQQLTLVTLQEPKRLI